MTALPPSPFLTESPESVETPSRVSTVMEAAATIEPPLAAAADPFIIPNFADVPEIVADDISDVHEIFHHARRLVAEKPANQALLEEITQEWNRTHPPLIEWPRFELDVDRFMRDIDADPVPLFLR
jgi:hypothetical protein